MKHKRKLPEDGCLKPLSSSSISTSCNIMIIRVPDELKGPGEMTYQLATLDRNKEGIEHIADKYVDKLIPNLPKVNAPTENRSELKNTTDTSNTYFRRRRIKKKTEADREEKFQSLTNEIKEKQKSSIDIDPWIQKPWENQSFGFYSEINPNLSKNSFVSNSYDPVACGSVRNQYACFSNDSYNNNYNTEQRSGGVPNNLYVNRNNRNVSMNNRMSKAFASSSDKGSFMTDPSPYNGLGCETLTSTMSLNDNFARYQRNVTSRPMFKKKMFPRKNQNNFRGTNPQDFNFNRNSRFKYKNNEYESGNREEISNHDISNNSNENFKGSSEIYDKYQAYTKVTSREDMCVRTSENRSNESVSATGGFVSPFTNEQFKKKNENFSNSGQFTASHSIAPGRFKNKRAFFMNSRTFRGNFSSRKSYIQGDQKQNIFPGRYNNRGRYMRRRGNFTN